MKKWIRSLIPVAVILQYHRAVAWLAALRYGFPSRKLIVIGVTGTKGKTTTVNFIWSTLMAGDIKTGIITTANIRIGNEEVMNKYHMTMPGRFTIQQQLRRMVRQGCWVAIVETTSEGLKQYRHAGVYYDIGVFTNLTPEHLQSHGGSFEKYKEMKGRMFVALGSHKKHIAHEEVEKVIIANADSEWASYYLSFPADKKITYGIQNEANVKGNDIKESASGVDFSVAGHPYHLNILGGFNVINALPAIAVARHLQVSEAQIAQGLEQMRLIPGRMEVIDEGQAFQVIVDYAHEKESMTRVLAAGRGMAGEAHKVIVLLGAEGGGRDKNKRAHMGELVGKLADYVIASNVDPYEDDPTEIVEDIARVAEQYGKTRGENLFVIEDRREGIAKALRLAQPGDVVLITGKGAEQSIVIGGVSAPWDDRTVVREELKKL